MIALLKKFVNSTIGTAGAKPLDTMIGEVKSTNLITYGSAVKSVQRGTAISALTSNNRPYYGTTITINAVTANRCDISVSGIYTTYSGSTGEVLFPPRVVSISSNQLVIGVSNGSTSTSYASDLYNGGYFSWQIIEYY